eukprot:1879588-Prymnesium_polylepis.1
MRDVSAVHDDVVRDREDGHVAQVWRELCVQRFSTDDGDAADGVVGTEDVVLLLKEPVGVIGTEDGGQIKCKLALRAVAQHYDALPGQPVSHARLSAPTSTHDGDILYIARLACEIACEQEKERLLPLHVLSWKPLKTVFHSVFRDQPLRLLQQAGGRWPMLSPEA